MIPLKEALRIMGLRDQRNWPVPYSISFFTADRSRDTGGELITLSKVVLAKNAPGQAPKGLPADKAPGDSKNFISGTRNLYDLDRQEVRKCHLWLIHSINGQEVTL